MLLLTHQELTALTGSPLPSRQLKWLKERHWKYETGLDGRPKVLHEYAVHKLGAPTKAPERTAPLWM